MTHSGGPPKWAVLKDSSAPSLPNVLAQSSNDTTAGRFPLAIWDKTSLKDGALSVKFKAVSGTVDQAAGLVWRYRDANNYYIVRANALENNVVLYKVQNGERLSLAPKGAVSNAYGVKHSIPKQTWSTLSVTLRDDLRPSTRPKRSMISDERKGKEDAEEQAEHRADYRGSEAG